VNFIQNKEIQEMKKLNSKIIIFLCFPILTFFALIENCSKDGTTQNNSALIQLNKSSQIFEPSHTFQIVLGDLDSDGDLDAVFSNMLENNAQIWLNDGTGYFSNSDQQLIQGTHGVALGDLDGDGDLDIFLSENTESHLNPSKIYFNGGSGVFTDSGQDIGDKNLWGNRVDLIDIDGDSDLDAYIVYYLEPDLIYLNDGNGIYEKSAITFPENYSMFWGDLDSDGDVDLFIKEYGTGYKTMLNDGSGNFSDHWQQNDSNILRGNCGIADVDQDGDLDVLVANGDNTGSSPTIVMLNDGTGRFADSGQELSSTISARFGMGDLDGNGYIDAFITNFGQPNEVWLNDGNGNFTDTGLRLSGNARNSGSVLGDLDGDGDLDVFVTNFGEGSNEIWFNE